MPWGRFRVRSDTSSLVLCFIVLCVYLSHDKCVDAEEDKEDLKVSVSVAKLATLTHGAGT